MRYRHIARGSIYTLLSAYDLFLHELSLDESVHIIGNQGETAILQCSTAKAENARYGGPVCLYQCEETHKLYLRPRFEFFDTERFERLDD